jgi:hypothetical protein
MVSNPTKSAGQRIKPTLDTKFHIDYSWWDREDRDLRTYLISHLLPEQRERFDQEREEHVDERTIDWIDPETAEVRRVDAVQQALTQAALHPDYISDHTTLVDAVFRVFLANSNQPLSANELGERINRQSSTLLRTLSGAQVYKGIRPIE